MKISNLSQHTEHNQPHLSSQEIKSYSLSEPPLFSPPPKRTLLYTNYM